MLGFAVGLRFRLEGAVGGRRWVLQIRWWGDVGARWSGFEGASGGSVVEGGLSNDFELEE